MLSSGLNVYLVQTIPVVFMLNRKSLVRRKCYSTKILLLVDMYMHPIAQNTTQFPHT